MRDPYDTTVLIEALARPQSMAGLSCGHWGLLLRQARMANVLSRLALATDELGLSDQLPGKACHVLSAASRLFAYQQQRLRWEVGRVEYAMRGVDTKVLLLKGAAYEFAGLPAARGRIATDLDIMVPEDKLEAVEAALLDHGWEQLQRDAYDQHYFRRWMHELPPLVHGLRGTVVDVHHGILPRTSRLKPDVAKLWAGAREVPGTKLSVLSPHDMILHSAAHAFHDGELRFALRDLCDLHDLLTCFGAQAGFWDAMIPRAVELNLERPLSYALRFVRQIFRSPLPEVVARDSAKHAPPAPIVRLMDRLVPRVLLPAHPDAPPRQNRDATLLLYIRSHWLKMPPLLLTSHLVRKALKRPNAG